jgi:hypothetical protein
MAVIEWGNPYTHEEHRRESIPGKDKPGGGGCDWCGRKRRTLFQYDGRTGWFCDKGCYHAYHFNSLRE